MGLILKAGKTYTSPEGIPVPMPYASIIEFEPIDRLNQRSGGIIVGIFYNKEAFLEKKKVIDRFTFPGAKDPEAFKIFFGAAPDRPTLGESNVKRSYQYLQTKADYFPHFNLNDWESDEVQVQEPENDPIPT